MGDVIDLRSDTVTRPTTAMRRAIAEAEVGDDVCDVDPTAERLERTTAELLGKESALFVPSGAMANQIALRTHCPSGSEFFCEAECHLYRYEQGAFAPLSGLIPRLIATDDSTMRVDQLEGQIRPDDEHFPRAKLLCIENTHNRWGGRVQPQADVAAVCGWARSNRLATHLDGARLWNAASATGCELDELASPFDSVSVCFSKGLGAPVGSALAGSKEFIHEARRNRKLFGGAMRQVGIIAAGALYAVENHRERLSQDHENARRLGEAITSVDGFSIRGGRIDTNIVMVEMDGAGAGEFVGRLKGRGVWCFDVGPSTFRLVTHLDVDDAKIDRACQILRETAEQFQSEAAL